MESFSKTSLIKWKPSELLEVQSFCSSRKLEFSSLARKTLLYVVKHPSVFAGYAQSFLDAETTNKLRFAELPLSWDAPEVPEKPQKKGKRRRKGGKVRVRP